MKNHKIATPERYDVVEYFNDGRGNCRFMPTNETVFALNDGDALSFAKRLGIVNPILQRIRNTHEIVV